MIDDNDADGRDVPAAGGTDYQAVIGHVARFTAHALGNPLAGLSLTLDLLASATTEADTRRLVARCQRISERLNSFKENLGALGGGAAGPLQDLELEPFLEEWQGTLNLAGAYAMPVQLAPEARTVRVHAGLLANALSYLFRNACDANPDGGTIGIKTARVADGVRLTVWDDGPGLPAELVSGVFRAPISTKKHGGGLGLLIVSMIVEQIHRGRLHYAPNTPHGCQFHLDFLDGPNQLS